MAIRYDKALNKEINRVIGNFNAKVRRLEQNTDLMTIPDTISKRELKQSVRTRRELYRKLKELKTFSKRGIERPIETLKGAKISKYDYLKLKKEVTRMKRKLTEDIKKYKITKPKVYGKYQDVTFAQTGDNAYLTVLAQREKLNKNLMQFDAEQFVKFGNFIKRLDETRNYYDTLFKSYYIDMFTGLGREMGYDEEKLKEIEKKLSTLTPDNFYKLFKEEKSIQAVKDYDYSPHKKFGGQIDIDAIRDDVFEKYDAIYDNIDEILKDYA